MRCKSAPSLAQLTTLTMGGTAVVLLEPESLRDLECLPERLRQEGGTPFVLGRGSNILACEGTLPYALVRWQGDDTLSTTPLPGNRMAIRAGASVALPRLVAFGANLGCEALAGLAGIPGEVGGAVAMNAGSYGIEFATLVQEMTVFTPERGLETLTADAFTPGYRHTVFAHRASWLLVLDVTLNLATGNRKAALSAVGEHIHRKAATQPVRAASAGCVFRNPQGQSAGKLLDACGFRGKTLGGVAFSPLHANFLVNTNHGSANEALELLAMAKKAVQDTHGICLAPEVKFLPAEGVEALPC